MRYMEMVKGGGMERWQEEDRWQREGGRDGKVVERGRRKRDGKREGRREERG